MWGEESFFFFFFANFGDRELSIELKWDMDLIVEGAMCPKLELEV